jgi:hypothetical protein
VLLLYSAFGWRLAAVKCATTKWAAFTGFHRRTRSHTSLRARSASPTARPMTTGAPLVTTISCQLQRALPRLETVRAGCRALVTANACPRSRPYTRRMNCTHSRETLTPSKNGRREWPPASPRPGAAPAGVGLTILWRRPMFRWPYSGLERSCPTLRCAYAPVWPMSTAVAGVRLAFGPWSDGIITRYDAVTYSRAAHYPGYRSTGMAAGSQGHGHRWHLMRLAHCQLLHCSNTCPCRGSNSSCRPRSS